MLTSASAPWRVIRPRSRRPWGCMGGPHLLGRSAQGLAVVRDAVDMATRYAGASSPVALQNLLFLSDTQVATQI